jgi:hypothetical protein
VKAVKPVQAAAERRDQPSGNDEESLKDALGQTLDEARMVPPGVQALFGFQLIAVFSDGFERLLSEAERNLHLAAIVLVTIAIALLMTPAAYHRQVDRRSVTGEFLVLASRLISGAMLPLAAGLLLDIQIVTRVVSGELLFATALGGVAFTMFAILWFALPRWRAASRRGRQL